MRHKQDLAHFVQKVICPPFNTRSPRHLLTATIGVLLFHISLHCPFEPSGHQVLRHKPGSFSGDYYCVHHQQKRVRARALLHARVVLFLFANFYFSRLFIFLFYLMLYMFRFVFFPRFIVLLFALKRCEPINPSSASLTNCPRTCVDQGGTLIIACTMLFAPTKCLIYHTCPYACIP